jgi:arylsulfatase A-like enzyme
MSTPSISETAIRAGAQQVARQNPPGTAFTVLIAVWFGIVTGLIEGSGLLVFERINWVRWGPMIHVSRPIIWISPIVDTAFFLILSLLVWLLSRAIRRIPAQQTLVFLLSFLAIYDWLTVTGRLYRFACVLLALGAAAVSVRWFAAHEQKGVQLCKTSLPVLIGLFLSAFLGIEGTQWWNERSATAALAPAATGAPNVLVIVMDTLRADHVSSYGYSRPTTPNLDRLAKEGVLFQNAIAPSSWSLPSHVSLVTGKYLHDHKVGDVQPEPWLGWQNYGLGGFPTIGEALEKAGYRTAAFSANRTYFSHDLGFGRGFIHFEDYFNSASDCFVRTLYGREFARIYLNRSQKSLMKRILRRLGLTSLLDQDAEGSGSYGGAFGIRKHADEVNRELQGWIGRGSKRPFFAMLNYFDVHDPYGGPSSYPKPAWPQHSDIDRYDDGVKYADDCLGRLIESLEQEGLSTNTLVIVTSDHGESLGQHFLMTHGRALYWELIHVPLIIWFPGRIPAGTVMRQPVSNVAIPATIMELLGGSPGTFSGPGLGSAWRPATREQWSDPISELAQSKYPGKHDRQADELIPTAASGPMQTVVSTQWQLIVHQKLGAQLYNWNNDPAETRNLIDTPEGRAAAEQLEPEIKSTSR